MKATVMRKNREQSLPVRVDRKPWSIGCSNYLQNTKQTSTFRTKALRWQSRQLPTNRATINAVPSLETSKFALYFSGSLNNLTHNQA